MAAQGKPLMSFDCCVVSVCEVMTGVHVPRYAGVVTYVNLYGTLLKRIYCMCTYAKQSHIMYTC